MLHIKRASCIRYGGHASSEFKAAAFGVDALVAGDSNQKMYNICDRPAAAGPSSSDSSDGSLDARGPRVFARSVHAEGYWHEQQVREVGHEPVAERLC